MLVNYLKIALRTLLKYKGYALINVSGLAIGMACSTLILLWVLDEMSYDQFHQHADTLYRIEENQYYSGRLFRVGVTPHPAGPLFEEAVPELADVTRYKGIGTLSLQAEGEVFYEEGIYAIDPSFLSMFTFPLRQGDPTTVLSDPYSLVLTREMAEKHFPGEDPVGKVVTLDGDYAVTITGVLEDIPDHSILQFNMLIPFELLKPMERYSEGWGNSIYTYVRLNEEQPLKPINEKLTATYREHVESSTEMILMPLTRIRLHGVYGFDGGMGNIWYVYIFASIAVFVLLVACINFTNLATARAARRAKEIGVRKVLGASHTSVAYLICKEFLVLVVVANLLVWPVAWLVMTNWLDDFPYRTSLGVEVFVLSGLLALVIALVTVSYQALKASLSNPVDTLRYE